MFRLSFRVNFCIVLISGISYNLFSQNVNPNQNSVNGQVQSQIDDIEDGIRPVQAAVPFINITPNARAASMGDQGVATSPDEYSAFWNPGKLAMLKKKAGFAICYNPWLAKLVNDMSLSYVTGYYKLRREDAIALSLTYFNLGTINFTDNTGAPIIDYTPREYAIAASYSRLLGRGFSAGVSIKYIYSNLSGSISNSAETQSKPGQAAAADLGFYYNKDLVISERDFNLAAGISVANVGGKISYSNTSRQDFIPAIIRLGSVITHELDDFNKFSFGFEASKLMVPTSQIQYSIDSKGNKTAILVTPNKSLFAGTFGSFGDYNKEIGFKEELQEIMLSFGLEYWYDNMFAVRGGYFHENFHKGNRKYFTLGLGVRYQVFGLDFAYLVATERTNPLSETLRFSLSFNFGEEDKVQESVVE